MIPSISKRMLKHFLLNLLTVLKVESSNLNDNDKKKEIIDLINLASVIVSYEKVIIGEKMDFFIQEVSLSEVFELINRILEEKLMDNNIEITTSINDITIRTDKHYFTDALKFIISRLTDNCKRIDIQYKKDINILNIKVDSDIKEINEIQDISSYLNIETLNKNDITFAIGIKLLKLLSIDIKTHDKSLNLVLKTKK